MMDTAAALTAEAERDRVRERIADVKQDQKQRGRYLGGTPPFGFRVGPDGSLEPVEHEQAALRRAVAMRAERKPLRAIQAALASEGIRLSLGGLHQIMHKAVPVQAWEVA